jgi:hypothetical protein
MCPNPDLESSTYIHLPYPVTVTCTLYKLHNLISKQLYVVNICVLLISQLSLAVCIQIHFHARICRGRHSEKRTAA